MRNGLRCFWSQCAWRSHDLHVFALKDIARGWAFTAAVASRLVGCVLTSEDDARCSQDPWRPELDWCLFQRQCGCSTLPGSTWSPVSERLGSAPKSTDTRQALRVDHGPRCARSCRARRRSQWLSVSMRFAAKLAALSVNMILALVMGGMRLNACRRCCCILPCGVLCNGGLCPLLCRSAIDALPGEEYPNYLQK